MKKRVVITGAGVVSPIGAGVDAFWANCLKGKTRVETIPEHWLMYADLASQIWSPLPEVDYSAIPTKSLIGHTIGASGAIEALVAACSIHHQTPYALKNLHQPLRDLNFVKEVKKYPIRTALSQSFAFGGQNAGIALERV